MTITAALLMSCATTHKTETSASSRTFDTSSVVRTDTSALHSECRDSVTYSVTDSAVTSTRTNESIGTEETITERIIETIDSMGRKVTTTDRNITRRGTTHKETATNASNWHEQEQTAVMLSMLDSIANAHFGNIGTHWAQMDSTHQEKATEPVATATIWDKIWGNIGKIIGAALFIAFCIFVWKTKD